MDQQSVEITIDGTLDLHHFSPRDIKFLVPDYLRECRRKNILQVRIVHGKGIGNLRRTVHSVLDRLPYVKGYKLGDLDSGSWGATLVFLLPEK